jgi:hypothetical protein
MAVTVLSSTVGRPVPESIRNRPDVPPGSASNSTLAPPTSADANTRHSSSGQSAVPLDADTAGASAAGPGDAA